MYVDYEDGLRHGAAFGFLIGTTTMMLVPIISDVWKGVSRRLTSSEKKQDEQLEMEKAAVTVLGKINAQLEDISETGKTLVERSNSLMQKKAEKQRDNTQYTNGATRG